MTMFFIMVGCGALWAAATAVLVTVALERQADRMAWQIMESMSDLPAQLREAIPDGVLQFQTTDTHLAVTVPEPITLDAVPVPDQRFDAAGGEIWVEAARAAALTLIAGGAKYVTSDDIWDACPPPAGVDGRLMAVVFSRKEWAVVGYQQSQSERNGWKRREIAQWAPKSALEVAA